MSFHLLKGSLWPCDLLQKYTDFNYRGDVQFSIMQGGSKAHSLDEAKFAASTVGDMFEWLMQTGHLTEKDGKNKTISLRIDLWEGQRKVCFGTHDAT